MNQEEEPDHPVLASPWRYQIVSLRIDCSDPADQTLEMALAQGDERRTLRFTGVQRLTIDSGFPYSGGLRILDIRTRQWEGLGVQVANFEGSGGCPEFWAREVVEV